MNRVCCRCLRPPEAFPIESGDGTGQLAYWFVVPKNNPEDPTHLMSSGELMFAMCPDENPPDDIENDFICFHCFGDLYADEDDEEDEDEDC